MLKDKVLKFIDENDLHGKNTMLIVHSVFKGLDSKYSRKKINKALDTLQEEGLWQENKNKLKPSKESLVLKGIFTLGKYGKGRITTTVNGEKVTYYVPARNTAQAFNKSLVTYELEYRGEGRAPFAKITGVLAAKLNRLYGVVQNVNGQLQFLPDDTRFLGKVKLQNNELTSLAEGKKCYVTIDNPRDLSLNKNVVGIIADKSQIFGNINSPIPNILSILEQAEVPMHFSKETLQEAAEVSQTVSEEEISKVKDLRHIKFTTIDPETCKDMDDAVYAEKWYKNGIHVGYIVYEATAHVSHYVKPNTTLDKEAFTRGTSIYPAGGVIPMLPESLSNGICSLNEGEDRLALVTTMKIGKNGVISEYDICEAAINSKKKFSYEEASAIYHNHKDMIKYADFKEDINNLYEAATALEKNRAREGRLKVQGYDPTIILNDAKDKVIDFRNDNNVDSHKVIEEIMVATNQVIAKTLSRLKIPNIYRIHDYPTEKKLTSMLTRVQQLGLNCEGFENGVDNKTYQDLMTLAEKHPLKKVLSQLIIRSLPKAKYDITDEIGHFALALKDYSHTTSPIRRYSDIIAHRNIIKVLDVYKEHAKNTNININLGLSENLHLLRKYAANELDSIERDSYIISSAEHLNAVTERAEDISRQTDHICAILHMQNNLGKTFKGYVSSVDEFEVMVTLSDKDDPEHSEIIEVMIPKKEFNASNGVRLEKNYTQVVKNNSNEVLYSLGQELEVKIYSADINSRKILATTDLSKEIIFEENNSSHKVK